MVLGETWLVYKVSEMQPQSLLYWVGVTGGPLVFGGPSQALGHSASTTTITSSRVALASHFFIFNVPHCCSYCSHLMLGIVFFISLVNSLDHYNSTSTAAT
jgi:hypothetical protein